MENNRTAIMISSKIVSKSSTVVLASSISWLVLDERFYAQTHQKNMTLSKLWNKARAHVNGGPKQDFYGLCCSAHHKEVYRSWSYQSAHTVWRSAAGHQIHQTKIFNVVDKINSKPIISRVRVTQIFFVPLLSQMLAEKIFFFYFHPPHSLHFMLQEKE